MNWKRSSRVLPFSGKRMGSLASALALILVLILGVGDSGPGRGKFVLCVWTFILCTLNRKLSLDWNVISESLARTRIYYYNVQNEHGDLGGLEMRPTAL